MGETLDIDARGVEAGTKDAERSIRYVTKYVAVSATPPPAAPLAA